MEKGLKHIQPIDIELLDDYVKLCSRAMCSCKESNSYSHSENDKDMIFERDFIISLAYNMGRLEEKEGHATNYLIGGEINKYVFDHYFRNESEKEKLIDETQKQLGFKTDYVTPDFLIHKYKKLDEIKKGGQKLVIEAKTKGTVNDNDFFNDFFKLNVYLVRLSFEYAVYILINQSVDSIDKMIDNYINKGFYVNTEWKDRLIFLIQENEKEYPQSFQFK